MLYRILLYSGQAINKDTICMCRWASGWNTCPVSRSKRWKRIWMNSTTVWKCTTLATAALKWKRRTASSALQSPNSGDMPHTYTGWIRDDCGALWWWDWDVCPCHITSSFLTNVKVSVLDDVLCWWRQEAKSANTHYVVVTVIFWGTSY